MTTVSAKRLISFIVPVFNEVDNLDLLVSRINEVREKLVAYSTEVLFVNDGSQDQSWAKLRQFAEVDASIKLVDFSRNFGHQMAVTAGLDSCTGAAAVVLDADLQDPPELAIDMVAKWEEGYDVVYAQRKTRKDTLFKRATASLFYRTLDRLSEVEIPRNTGDFRLVDRAVIDQVNSMREHNRFIRGMVSYVGFRQVALPFDRDERHAGTTGYPLGKMVRFALDGILGFSTAPIKLISAVGYCVAGLSLLGIIYALCVRFVQPGGVVSGWTFTIITILLIGGLQFIFMGLIGSYIGRIYTEVQNRPLYIVRQKINIDENPAEALDGPRGSRG